MNKTQMELSFESSFASANVGCGRQKRSSRARWWFRQMHWVVNRARDWQTPPLARSEQAGLLLVKPRM
jgi:hypothetical protein